MTRATTKKRDESPPEIDPSLPASVFASAMADYLATQEARVRAMYNRHRAVFAEHLVATLLGGNVLRDPGAAWDVNWTPDPGRRAIRIQVKCSGEFLPRFRDRPAAARWGVKPPGRGFDEDFPGNPLGPGHHCDVFVLARHTGSEIASGWRFVVVARKDLDGRNAVHEGFLRKAGLTFVGPANLARAVREAAGRGRAKAR